MGVSKMETTTEATPEDSSDAESTDEVRQGLKTLNYQNYPDKTINQLPHAE